MADPFARTSQALERDRGRRGFVVPTLVLAFIVAWAGWFLNARVAVYAVSDRARVEVDRAPSPVESPVTGRVVATALSLGREVRTGDVLVELDTASQALEVNEERVRLEGLAPQLDRLEAEIRFEQSGGVAERSGNTVAIAEARARLVEAVAAAELADQEAKRAEALHAERLISDVDLLRAQAEAKGRLAASETLRLHIDRLAIEQRRRNSDQEIRIERLRREAAVLRGQSAAGSAAIETLEYEGARRRIVAPAAGTLAEVAQVRVGAFMREGDRVATVVPAGALRVVAAFAPGEALGRIRSGQHARVRLDGFPWTTHGSVDATVASIAREVRDGHVRVELAIDRAPASIPLEHGLPGTVDVDVERLSPLALVMRAAGARLASRQSAASPQP